MSKRTLGDDLVLLRDESQSWYIRKVLRKAGEVPVELFRLYGPYAESTAQILAERLRVKWDFVTVEHRPVLSYPSAHPHRG